MDYFAMYHDVWDFHKRYIDTIADKDEFWQAVTKEADELTKKYEKCKFMCSLVLNELDEMERISKRLKGETRLNLG